MLSNDNLLLVLTVFTWPGDRWISELQLNYLARAHDGVMTPKSLHMWSVFQMKDQSGLLAYIR